jgi:hypothetical protein
MSVWIASSAAGLYIAPLVIGKHAQIEPIFLQREAVRLTAGSHLAGFPHRQRTG